MEKLTKTLNKELILDGWNTSDLHNTIRQASIYYPDERPWNGLHHEVIRGLSQYLVYTYSTDEDDRLPGAQYYKNMGYPVRLMMFEYRRSGSGLKVVSYCYYEEARPLLNFILDELTGKVESKPKGRKKGMTEDRKNRALIFKDIKDKHPDMTLQQVANYANDNDNNDNIVASADMVKNDYRDMGWKWKRGKRTR